MKKGQRVLVSWQDNDWEPATFIKKATIEGCLVVKRDHDPFWVQVSAEDVRPEEPSKS